MAPGAVGGVGTRGTAPSVSNTGEVAGMGACPCHSPSRPPRGLHRDAPARTWRRWGRTWRLLPAWGRGAGRGAPGFRGAARGWRGGRAGGFLRGPVPGVSADDRGLPPSGSPAGAPGPTWAGGVGRGRPGPGGNALASPCGCRGGTRSAAGRAPTPQRDPHPDHGGERRVSGGLVLRTARGFG